jgi:prepilin-type N-terminal cleavage/methylation domain-containing protein
MSQLLGSAGLQRGGQHGVTMVELVVILAVVAILALAAYPYISNLREVMLVKGAAEQTVAAVRLARQIAITHGSNHCIEFRANPRAQYRILQDTDSTCSSGTVVPGHDWHDLADQYTGTITVTPVPKLVFDPIGNRILPTGVGPTTFTVDSSPASCLTSITVTQYGGVRAAAGSC